MVNLNDTWRKKLYPVDNFVSRSNNRLLRFEGNKSNTVPSTPPLSRGRARGKSEINAVPLKTDSGESERFHRFSVKLIKIMTLRKRSLLNLCILKLLALFLFFFPNKGNFTFQSKAGF